MVLFAADHHYDTHAGKILAEELQKGRDLDFHENDWSCFGRLDGAGSGDVLMLNMISGSCDIPPPKEEAAKAVRGFLERRGGLFLVHAGSAAFWQYDWWREAVGMRWVRDDDPDGFDPSTHPRMPYSVLPAKSRHPLCSRLLPMEFAEDEIYTELEQTQPLWTLMYTRLPQGTYAQCYLAATPWGGTVVGFLPGHRAEVARDPVYITNVEILLNFLTDA